MLLDLRLQERFSAVQEIAAAAAEEAVLGSKLTKLRQDLEALSFELQPFEDSGTYILVHTDELQVRRVAC